MTRPPTITVALAVALALLADPVSAHAQRADQVPVVGILCARFCRAFSLWDVAPEGRLFRDTLREYGFVDGQNVLVDIGGAGVATDQLPRRAGQLIRRNAAVILAVGLTAALVAKRSTRTTPIVMVDVPDAVEFGLVASLARPGGNITGLTTPSDELVAKQLELLTEAVPRLSRVAVLSNPANPEYGPTRKALLAAALVKGVELQFVEMQSGTRDDLDRVFSAIRDGRAGALLVLRDPVLSDPEVKLFALTQRIPTISTEANFVRGGGLMAYEPDPSEMVRRAATYVGRILKGRKPTDLPVERPSRFALVVNLSTAKAIGLTFPQSLLLRVDAVIQ